MRNQKVPTLEIIVCSVADAIAAKAGGATRLEIISRYDLGGLTPSFDLVREIVETVRIPARVMLRESEDFVVTDQNERERLSALARSFAELPIDGFVLGFLESVEHDLQIDHTLTAQVLASAPHINATFHRAFEALPDPLQAIAELKRHAQIDCILSRGKGETWEFELDRFVKWEQVARPEIEMLIGGGTDDEALRLFCEKTELRAFHVGRFVREDQRIDGPVQAEKVAALATMLSSSG